MKKVKMLVDTAYKGPKKAGDFVDVPDDFARRWAKNGIAEIVEGADTEEEVEETEEEVEATEDEGSEEQESEEEEVDYESMKAKELYDLCVEKGIEVKKQQPKQYYIDLLLA